MNEALAQPTAKKMSHVEMAEHKFNQTRILAMASRLDLIVRYFHGLWVFIEPVSDKPWTEMFDDSAALNWLSTIPYPRKPGTLEKRGNEPA